jgi:hypothetical protein
MRPARDGMTGHALRWAAVALTISAVAGCGGSGTSSPTVAPTVGSTAPPASSQVTPSPAASAAASSALPSPAPSKGPATAQISLTGGAGLTGPVTAQTINCNRPSLDGPEIFFIGQAGSGPMIVIFLGARQMEVRVATGSAATLKERDFTGTGVTTFDAASGAQFSSPLSETTAAGTAVGTLGALSSISGSIDCGDQLPGTANVVVSGLTPYGQLSGALTSVDVTCTVTVSSGTFVGVTGLGMAGATPVLVFVTASTGLLQVAVETKTAGTFYSGKGAGLATLVPGGATMSGDVPESVAAGASPSPNLVHVMGTATCGKTIHQ